MRNFMTIWCRELAAYFLSPVAYVTFVAYLTAAATTFMVGVLQHAGGAAGLSNVLFDSLFVWLPVLLTVVAMRLFAEEKRSGTMELLMTAPVTEREVVFGKFAGAFTFVLAVLLPTVSTIFLLKAMCPGITLQDIDLGAIGGGVLILVLATAFFLALGLLISLTARNQIAVAVSTLSLIWLVLMAGWLLSLIPGSPRQVTDYISVTRHVTDFAQGLLELRPVILYLSGTGFLLFVAVRLLESDRWK